MPASQPNHHSSTTTALAAATVEAKPFPVSVVPAAPLANPNPPVEVLAQPTLRTPRLMLRPLTSADRTPFAALLAQSREQLKGRINLHTDNEPDTVVFDRLLAATEAGDARGTDWRRAAFLTSGQPVGMVHVLHIQRGMEFRGDAGWWVGTSFCGNGIATEMVRALVHHAHRDLPVGLGLFRIAAAICPTNAASKRVATNAGFKRIEGAMTNVIIQGRHESHEVWESTAPD